MCAAPSLTPPRWTRPGSTRPTLMLLAMQPIVLPQPTTPAIVATERSAAVRIGLDPVIHALATAWIHANDGVDHRVEPAQPRARPMCRQPGACPRAEPGGAR